MFSPYFYRTTLSAMALGRLRLNRRESGGLPAASIKTLHPTPQSTRGSRATSTGCTDRAPVSRKIQDCRSEPLPDSISQIEARELHSMGALIAHPRQIKDKKLKKIEPLADSISRPEARGLHPLGAMFVPPIWNLKLTTEVED